MQPYCCTVQGAKKLYEEFVKPFLFTHAGKIDPVFNSTKAVSSCSACS